jgi:hypothetical protein
MNVFCCCVSADGRQRRPLLKCFSRPPVWMGTCELCYFLTGQTEFKSGPEQSKKEASAARCASGGACGDATLSSQEYDYGTGFCDKCSNQEVGSFRATVSARIPHSAPNPYSFRATVSARIPHSAPNPYAAAMAATAAGAAAASSSSNFVCGGCHGLL